MSTPEIRQPGIDSVPITQVTALPPPADRAGLGSHFPPGRKRKKGWFLELPNYRTLLLNQLTPGLQPRGN